MLCGPKKISLFALAACALPLVAACVVWKALFHFDQADREEYRLLLSRSDASLVSEDDLPQGSVKKTQVKQEREGILKEFYYFRDGKRLHTKVLADHAELFLEGTEEGLEMKEKMHQVTCVMQEELYYQHPDGRKLKTADLGQEDQTAMQAIRVLHAGEAEVSYRTNRLTASDAELSRLIASGHDLTDPLPKNTLTMQGKASQIEFSLENPAKDFKASHLRATFYDD